MSEKTQNSQNETSRRSFVKKTGAAAAAAGSAIAFPSVTFGAPNDKKLKVGVIGTGGRGGGAMINSMNSDDNIELWAVGDLYQRRGRDKKLAMVKKYGISRITRFPTPSTARVFSGIDCYKQVLDSGVDRHRPFDDSSRISRPAFQSRRRRRCALLSWRKPCATDMHGVKEFLEDSQRSPQRKISPCSADTATDTASTAALSSSAFMTEQSVTLKAFTPSITPAL